MKTTEIVAAWERGDIDAAYTWQPSLGEILKTGKVLISSAEMAEKGYITANVDIVRKGFSSQYPDLVVDFIQMLSEAGDIYRNDPDKAAEIVSEELEIPKEEALKQMQGSLWVTAEDLLGDAYFGTSENPGKFAEIMKDTGDFLVEQNSIDTSPSQEKFNEFVNPKYIEMYLERD
jgi:taurine transport system substrate-binding protein